MKKPLLMGAMLLISTFAFAQTQKGQVQLGGVFNYNQQENGNIKSTNFNFIPQAGYFVSDLTSIGLLLDISSNKFENPGGESERNLFEFGVFARFHKSIADKLYLYLQPSLSFGSGENDNALGGTTDLNTTTIQIRPGIMYFATPKIAIEMAVGSAFYNGVKETTGSNEITNDNFGLIFNLANVNLGVSLFL